MVKGLYTAWTGMVNQQNRMDVLTNNLANSATVGFKKEGATSQAFDDVLAYKIKDSSDPDLARKIGKMSLGVKIGENYTDYSQGAFKVTDNTFDLALSGEGFFACEYTNKSGETSVKYTRDGSFTLNVKGELVTKDGDFVLDENGDHIVLDPNKTTSFDQSGAIMQNGEVVGYIQIADFEDYNYLEHYGESYYLPVEGAQMKEAEAKMFSGYLEQSNVTVINEMVELISVSRNYETNQKMIQTIDGTLEIAANQLGKI
ncbi:MAG: flagellar hook-basal body protein [Lachnospiraceae bacterium]|nr:flagellar hook-basal body protein [Lachnospiraceae bacterium]